MNFVQSIIDLLKSFWPLEIVQEWERGEYYVLGRHWKSFGPGMLWVVPWFCRVINVQVKPSVISTPRMDLTLKSGGNITFAATSVVQVVNSSVALNEIDNYRESTQEVLSAVLSDRLVRVKEDRLESESRASLLRDLTKWVSEETSLFGVECKSVRFTTFVQGPRTFRLLTDSATPPWLGQ
jgi:regulator of protease activity HflC (stomatin/prohibitin superfamily)